MPIRLRKFIATIVLMVWLVIWVVLAMGLAQVMLPGASGWGAALYYVIAGFGWLPPAMLIISWMSRPDADVDPR
jgi:hypothetical protein